MSQDKVKSTINSTSLPPQGPRPGGLGHRHGGGMRGLLVEKPKDFKGTMRKLIKYLRPYYVSIILVLLTMASPIFNVSTKILGDITNKIVRFEEYCSGR